MRKFYSLLVFFLLSISLYPHPVRIAATYFGSTGTDALYDVAFADDGTIVVVGSSNNFNIPIPAGVPKHVIGTDDTSTAYLFVLRLSNDGKQVLSFTRFATGSVKIKEAELAVTTNGIYIVMVGNSAFAQLPGFDGKINASPGVKPAIIRMSLDAAQILNATYLGGSDSDRDINDIDVFPNGDLCVSHDTGGSWSDKLSRITPDLSGFVWTRTFDVWCGSARTNAMAVSPQGDLIYVGGYGMGHTGLEPYKDPYLFCFSGDGQTQYWKRGSNSKDYGVFNFPQAAIGQNRLISDSQVNALATDSLGNALMVGYSDGGATVFQFEPWYGGYYNTVGDPVPSGISDGDSFAGFSGATSASTIGLMNKNGEWLRMHAIKPYNTWNRWYGLTRGFNNSVFYAGRTSGIPDVNPWESGGTTGVIMKVVFDPALGTKRKFVTHLAGIDAMKKIARDRNTYRYAAIGKANKAEVFTVNPIQSEYGGGAEDGYILVFDDNDMPIEAQEVQVAEDAGVQWGTNADKNFGTATTFLVKRRDSRTYETSKTYLKFNITDINKPIRDARLVLYKSGKYDTGDAIVYALHSGHDNWNETAITWNNAPANVTASPWRIDTSKADSLGILKIAKTNSPAVVTYQGVAFTNYIESRRQSGQVNITFALTTGTAFTDQNDPVIKGASKESTGVVKPHLQLIFDRNPSVPRNMRLWPETIVLLPDQSQKFYANLFDQYGSIMNNPVQFSVDNGATITGDGIFQADRPGIYTITAECDGIIAKTTATIEITTAVKPTLSPEYKLWVENKNLNIVAPDDNPYTVTIYDNVGKMLVSHSNLKHKAALGFEYGKGAYIVRITNKNKSWSEKLVVNN